MIRYILYNFSWVCVCPRKKRTLRVVSGGDLWVRTFVLCAAKSFTIISHASSAWWWEHTPRQVGMLIFPRTADVVTRRGHPFWHQQRLPAAETSPSGWGASRWIRDPSAPLLLCKLSPISIQRTQRIVLPLLITAWLWEALGYGNLCLEIPISTVTLGAWCFHGDLPGKVCPDSPILSGVFVSSVWGVHGAAEGWQSSVSLPLGTH